MALNVGSVLLSPELVGDLLEERHLLCQRFAAVGRDDTEVVDDRRRAGDESLKLIAEPDFGNQTGKHHTQTKVGFDYIHAMVDDHSRLAYAEVLPDENGATCAGFLTRAAAAFAAAGIPRIDRVLIDNARNHRHSAAFEHAVAELGARQKFIRPHCPWTIAR